MSSKIREMKFLVIFHIFYPESWKEIKCYLDNLSIYNYDLVITYPRNVVNEEMLDEIIQYKDNVQIFAFDNRGFDVGAFVDVLQKINLNNYDAVFKIHSKGIKRSSLYMYGHYYKYKDWFNVLFRGCLGLFNTHRSIRKIAKSNIGIVAAKELIVQDPQHKKNFVKTYSEEFGIEYYDNYHFVAGTCMLFDAKILDSFKSYGFTIEDFEETTRGEFSFAHYIERALCMYSEGLGKAVAGNYTFRRGVLREAIVVNYNKRYSALRLLQDKRFIIDDNFFYRVLENKFIEKYQVKKIRLGDIRRYFNGKYYSLDECAPYRYLLGYHNEYYNYSTFHKDNDLPLMTKKRFEDLKESIENNGYDMQSLPIINQDNVIQDGQHRSCYLMFKYGPDYEVNVVKIWYKNRRRQKESYREYRKGFS